MIVPTATDASLDRRPLRDRVKGRTAAVLYARWQPMKTKS